MIGRKTFRQRGVCLALIAAALWLGAARDASGQWIGVYGPTLPYPVAYPPLMTNASSLPINVRDFGVHCDGVSEDSAGIRAAINAAAQASLNHTAATVVFPGGTCNFSATYDIQVPIILQCDPGGATILHYTGTGTAFIWEHATNAVSPTQYSFGPGIRDCTLSGPSTTGASVGLQMGNLASRTTQGAYFQNLKVTNFGTCVLGSTGFFLTTFVSPGFNTCTTLWNLTAAVNNGEGINVVGGTFFNAGKIDSTVFLAGGGGEFSCTRCSFDNAQVAATSGSFYCVVCHFEDPGPTAGNYDYIEGTGGAVSLMSSQFVMDDTTTATGTITEFVNMGGGSLYAAGNFMSNLGTHNALALTFGRGYSCGGSAHMMVTGTNFMNNVFTEYLAQGFCVVTTGAGVASPVQLASVPIKDSIISNTSTFTPNLNTGQRFELTFSAGDSTVTIAAPTGLAAPAAGFFEDETLYFELFNNSGKTLVVNWNAAYLGNATITLPGNGKRRVIVFQARSTGTQLIFVAESPSDI